MRGLGLHGTLQSGLFVFILEQSRFFQLETNLASQSMRRTMHIA